MTENGILKFILVALCFLIVITNRQYVLGRRDNFFLIIAMAATLGADFFLVILHQYPIGVAIFTIAHIAYALRFAGKRACLFLPLSLPLPLAFFLLQNDILMSLALLYAGLFITSYISMIHAVKRRRYPKINSLLIFLGMSFFVICDIFVAIFQLGEMGFLGNYALANFAHDAIWLFYAPSQFCLAISGIKLDSNTKT